MTNNSMTSAIDAFVSSQNQNRGQAGEEVALDYDALTGAVPAGGNAVVGISGIGAGAGAISLAGAGAVILDGAVGTTASTSGADNYGFSVDTSGKATLIDVNTGNTEVITGVNYLIFDKAATGSGGAFQSVFFIENNSNAQIAALYNAALGRQPDLAGLEYYANRITNGEQTIQQQASNFIASPEFQSRFPGAALPADNGGTNDQAFITALYQNVLHRAPAASELSYYAAALHNGEAGSIVDTTNPIQWSRAQELINFAASPENQSDISGWLINTGNGAVNFGALTSPQAATNVLTSQIASGTIDTASFATLPANSTTNSGGLSDAVNVSGVTIFGTNPTLNGGAVTGNLISFTSAAPANLTVDLSAQYNTVLMGSINLTVNGLSTGGSVIDTASTGFASTLNSGGTVNLAGNGNLIVMGNVASGGITTPTAINGWNSTDAIAQIDSSAPKSGTIYSGSIASKVSGTTLAALAYEGQGFLQNVFGIDVGPISNDTTATMVQAANNAYQVAGASVIDESAFFFGEDPQGNTMVFYWRGDTGHTGSIQASDMSGMIELVGVHASSLTGSNFHH